MNLENSNELKEYIKGFPIRPSESKHDYQLIHSIQLMVNGNQILPSILQLIADAKSSILFQVMLFHPDSAGKRISQELIKASQRGVVIKLMFNQDMSVSGSIAGRLPLDKRRKYKEALIDLKINWRRNGIEFVDNQAGLPKSTAGLGINTRVYERDLRAYILVNANHVDHRKLIVADGGSAIVGGANIGEEYLYMEPPDFSQNMLEAAKSRLENSEPEAWEKWLDTAIRFKGGIIPQLIEEFYLRWKMLGGKADGLKVIKNEFHGTKARLLLQNPGNHDIANEILNTFNRAKDSINLACPFVSHPEYIKALCQASSRGVNVNFVYPSTHNDMQISRRIIDFFRSKMFDSGINIYENKNRMIHTKLITVDSRLSMIGSANLNYRSAIHDFELNLQIESKEFAQEINRRVFEHYISISDLLLTAKAHPLKLFDRIALPFS